MNKLKRSLWLFAIILSGFIAQSQSGGADIYAVKRGDLWKYTSDDGLNFAARQLTRSGYNGGPVLSPDGRSFAFLQTSAAFLAQVKAGRIAPSARAPAADIWTYDLATSVYRQIADQTGGSDAGFLRSIPAWSPDSRQIAWLQLDPRVQSLEAASLVAFDFDSERASLIASDINLGYQSGDIVMPALRWGPAGIARLLFAYQHGSASPFLFVEIIQPATGERRRFDLELNAAGDNGVDDFFWGDHLGASVLLLRRGAVWEALDPANGARSILASPPRLKNRFLDGSLRLIPVAVAIAGGGWQIHWQAQLQGQPYATGYISHDIDEDGQPALSSDGRTVAWLDDDKLVTWTTLDSAAQFAASDSDSRAERRFPAPGPLSIVWTATSWQTTGETIGIQAAPVSSPQDTTCDLPPQLQPGDSAIVSPGLANRVRSAASLNAEVIGKLDPGEVAQVAGGPFCSHGYHWYEIRNARIAGWTVEGADGDYWLLYYIGCPGSPPIRLGRGMTAAVTPGQANNIRSAPGVDGTAILGKMAAGERFAILGNPVCDAPGLRWFPIQYQSLTGWTAAGQDDEYWIEPISET